MAQQVFTTPSGAKVTIDSGSGGVVSTQNAGGQNVTVPGQTYVAPTPAAPAPVAPVAPVNGGGSPAAPVSPAAPAAPSSAAPAIAKTSVAAAPNPGGYKLDANGNIVDSSGNIVAQKQSNGSYGNITNSSGASLIGIDPNGNLQFGTPSAAAAGVAASGAAVATATPPQTEDEIYQTYLSQSQGLIDSMQQEFDAQVTQNEQSGAVALQDAASLFGTTGAIGSAAKVSQNTAAANAATLAQSAQNVQTILNTLQTNAQTQANTEQTEYTSELEASQAYGQQQMTLASNSIAGLAKEGISYQQFSTDPKFTSTFSQLTQMVGGDPNTVQALFALGTPAANVLQSWTSGNMFNQLVQNPVTGAAEVHSYSLGNVSIPTNWTSTKIGTTGQFFQDPSNSSNTFTLTTDPYTGGITATGTGSGASWAQSYNQNSGSGGSSDTTTPPAQTTPPAGGGANYLSTFTQSLATSTNTDPGTASTMLSQPLTAVVGQAGVTPVVQAIVAAEGGSAQGVVNNPGNVKYVPGMANATDSGVKATDGGTFANFDTQQDGLKAIGDIVQGAASGSNSNYGATPTLQSFLNTYANLGGSSSASSSAPASGVGSEYGLLTADATNSKLQAGGQAAFDPSKPGLDSDAWNFIQTYLSSGTAPSSSSGMGGATTLAEKQAIQNRAEQVYYAATGQNLLSPTVSSNINLLQGNTSLLNTLGINAPTIAANAKLMLGKITAANVNQNAPAINAIIDPIAQAMGNPAVAAFVAQNSTLSNELGSLLALKNAGGAGASTVHDKLVAAGLVDSSATPAQDADTVNTILQEASNAQAAIAAQSLSIYKQVDPAGIMAGNPLNSPSYSQLSGAGFTWMGGSTYGAPDGTMYDVDASGNVTPVDSAATVQLQ